MVWNGIEKVVGELLLPNPNVPIVGATVTLNIGSEYNNNAYTRFYGTANADNDKEKRVLELVFFHRSVICNLFESDLLSRVSLSRDCSSRFPFIYRT